MMGGRGARGEDDVTVGRDHLRFDDETINDVDVTSAVFAVDIAHARLARTLGPASNDGNGVAVLALDAFVDEREDAFPVL